MAESGYLHAPAVKPPGKGPMYSLDMMPDGQTRWSGISGEELLTLQGKVISLQTWTDPGRSRGLSLPYFKTIGT